LLQSFHHIANSLPGKSSLQTDRFDNSEEVSDRKILRFQLLGRFMLNPVGYGRPALAAPGCCTKARRRIMGGGRVVAQCEAAIVRPGMALWLFREKAAKAGLID
jgi:hypothetical protein